MLLQMQDETELVKYTRIMRGDVPSLKQPSWPRKHVGSRLSLPSESYKASSDPRLPYLAQDNKNHN